MFNCFFYANADCQAKYRLAALLRQVGPPATGKVEHIYILHLECIGFHIFRFPEFCFEVFCWCEY